MDKLTDKVAIVTGAGRGLGAAIALALAQAGADLALLDLKISSLEQVSAEVRAIGRQVVPLAVNVADAKSVAEAVGNVIDRFGRIDILVNNAGIDHTLSIAEMTVEQWDEVIGVNLRGPFLLSKAVLPVMRRQGDGHIVNIASTAAKRAWANAAAYHASKWGLVGFTRALGVEGRAHNIRATTVVPGGMQTPFFDRLDVKPDLTNLQRPEAVAEVVVFIVSRKGDSVIQEVMVTPPTETSWP